MTVAELIEKLQELPQDAKVVLPGDGWHELRDVTYTENDEVYERLHPKAVSFEWKQTRVHEVRLGR